MRTEFLKVVSRHNPKLKSTPAAKLWKAGGPTKLGRRTLGETGLKMRDVMARAFSGNLHTLSTMEAMIAQQTSVRNDAARELEIIKEHRASKATAIDASFTPMADEPDD
jgi:hypothetical protein